MDVSSSVARRWHWGTPLRLVWNVGVAVGGVMVARLLGTITQIVLTRRMTLEAYGLYTALYTLLGVAVILAGFGLDTWLLRQASAPETLRIQTRRVFSLRLYATLVLMALGCVFLFFNGEPGMTLPLILAAGAGLLLEQMLTTGFSALRAAVRNQAAAILQVVAAGAFILLLWLLGGRGGISVGFATLCRLAAGGVGISLMIWLLRDRLALGWAPHAFWKLAKEARVYFAADLLANITLKADLTMITLLIGSTAAGLYNPALTIINTTFIVPAVAAQVLLPIIVRPTLPRREFVLIINLSVVASLVYGVAWFALLLWQAPWIIHLIFAQQYLAAAPLLQIMSLIPLMKSLNFCSATVMLAHDAQVLRTKLQTAGALANVLGNLVAIPLFGLVGAAWVNLLTELVLLVCYGWGAWATRARSA